MTVSIPLRTKAEQSAEDRVAAFIVLARDQLTNLIPTDEWPKDIWDVSPAFTRKGKPRVGSRLYYYQHGTLVGRWPDVTGSPLHSAFSDFARACTRYTHSAGPMTFERHQMRLHALG